MIIGYVIIVILELFWQDKKLTQNSNSIYSLEYRSISSLSHNVNSLSLSLGFEL